MQRCWPRVPRRRPGRVPRPLGSGALTPSILGARVLGVWGSVTMSPASREKCSVGLVSVRESRVWPRFPLRGRVTHPKTGGSECRGRGKGPVPGPCGPSVYGWRGCVWVPEHR